MILRPFQEEGVLGIYRFHGRCLLADEMGLGKTIQALTWIHRIPKRRPVVIVTPNSVKYAWQAEALLHFKIRLTVLEGQGPRKSITSLEDDCIVLNYDILHHWVPVLMNRPPQVVVFDECHYLANPKARRTRAARLVASKASSVLALSGTPMTNRPIQLWSILNIVRPDLFPDRFKFAWRYCQPKRTFWGWTFEGAERKGELYNILKNTCMIRRLKKDVAPELPDKIHKMIPFQLSHRNAAEYQKAKNDFLSWLKSKSPAKAHRAENNAALVKVGYLLRLCASLRMKQTIKFIEEFSESNPEKKLVGMTGHTSTIDTLKEAFPQSVVIDGRVTGKMRSESVHRFTNDRKIKYLWGNWVAAGAGGNYQKAHIFLSLDPPWTPGLLMQGQDRVHRIGQNEQVFIFHLFVKGSIEQQWLEILKERTETLREIMDGHGTPDDDMFGKLLQRLANE